MLPVREERNHPTRGLVLRPDVLGCRFDVKDPTEHVCNCTFCNRPSWTDETRLNRMQGILDRIAATVTVTAEGCWVAAVGNGRKGYRHITLPGRPGAVGAHRVVYELVVRPIGNKQIDHLCHTAACPGGPTCPHRACMNPEHLGLATNLENSARRTVRPAHIDGPPHGTTTRAGKPYNCKCVPCREARNEYQRDRRAANREADREYRRAYRERNRERIAAYQREYQARYRAKKQEERQSEGAATTTEKSVA